MVSLLLSLCVCVCVCAWVGGYMPGGVRFSNSNRIIPSDYRILLLLKMPIPTIYIVCDIIVIVVLTMCFCSISPTKKLLQTATALFCVSEQHESDSFLNDSIPHTPNLNYLNFNTVQTKLSIKVLSHVSEQVRELRNSPPTLNCCVLLWNPYEKEQRQKWFSLLCNMGPTIQEETRKKNIDILALS